MGNGLLEDLRREISTRSVIAVIGAGVSIGATNDNRVASWRGLLHHGVDRCGCELKNLTCVDERWAERVHDEINSGDLDDMLSAAEKISCKLGAPSGGEYIRWLRETIGELKAEQRDVLEALRDLNVTLATTNYDGLIEEVTGLPAVTWMDETKIERVLRGAEPGVLHLHGYWDKPESVILGIRSYETVLRDAHAQAMQRVMRFSKTLLFVGYGGGLDDPNFGPLLEWSAKVFARSEYRHFRLVRESEVTEVQHQHPPEQRILVLSFGEKHDQLAPFLGRLRPSPGRRMSGETVSAPLGQPALLPPAPHIFGRDTEVEDLVSTVLGTPASPAPLLGPPGVGKSALTLVAMNDPRVAARYGRRRFFVRCDRATSREMLVAEIARNVGLEIGPPLETALLSMLEAEPVVLALDNAETPWEADMLRVEELLARLAAVPGLALIASLCSGTRPGSVRWRDAIELRGLPLIEARKAFLAIVGEKFASDPHLDELLGALDGVPLAITLLGHTAEGEPDLKGVLIRWKQERTEMLQRADAKEKLTNIEICYELSLKRPRMTDEGRHLLRVLSCLPDGVAKDDVEAVYPGCGYKAAGILRKTCLASDEAGRLRVLAPLREYMGKKYPPQPDELAPVFAHYLGLAVSHGENVDEERSVEANTWLTVEIGNLETMILRALDKPGPEFAIQATISLAEFVRLTGLGSLAPLEKAAEIARNLDSQELFAHCLKGLGDIALARSDHKVARQHYETALSIYKNVSNILGHANCIYGFGNIALACDDHQAAQQHYEEAMPLYQRVDNILGQANCIKGLGDTALEISDHNAASQRYDKALPLYKSCGRIRGQANCVFRLGKIDLSSSDYDSARRRFEEALPLYQLVGDILGQANCVYSLGNIALELSDHDNARLGYKEALPLYQRVGQILGQANCIQGLAYIALERLDENDARRLLEEALALYGKIVAPYSVGLIHRQLARIAPNDSERCSHVAAARTAWQSIRRGDLLEELTNEFGQL